MRIIIKFVLLVVVLVSLGGGAPLAGQQPANDCIDAQITQDVTPDRSSPDYLLRWSFTFTNRCPNDVHLHWFNRYADPDLPGNWGSDNNAAGRPVRSGETYQPPPQDMGYWLVLAGGRSVPRPLVVWCAYNPGPGESDACFGDNDYQVSTANWRELG